MRRAHEREQAVGIGVYATETPGIGGQLRQQPADFRVRELERFDPEPVTADEDAYAHLVVRATLTNWDTNDFANTLSNRLGISRERIAWAGTKDRQAVTTQLFTIEGVRADSLPSIPRAELTVVGRAGRALQFGDLVGNEFSVVIRGVTDAGRAHEIADSLRAQGGPDRVTVPNFFGQQRFGSRRPITHEVGKRILKRDWEGAVMTYVGQSFETEPAATRAAREFVEETREWGRAIEKFPDGLRYERALLSALASGDDFETALEALPWNLRRLFVHAVQSAIFNRILTRRLEDDQALDSPSAGDVVCFSEERAGLTIPDPDAVQRVAESQVETVTRHCQRGRAFLTAPLVGTETAFGEGEPDAIAQDILEEMGIQREDFALPDPYGSTGTRRALCVYSQLTLQTDEPAATVDTGFSLPKGAYATALLREFLKGDPSAL
ncbi:MAG: tRNA pseudouridine(13) synthase TruD [Halobacteriaceae archaeon]